MIGELLEQGVPNYIYIAVPAAAAIAALGLAGYSVKKKAAKSTDSERRGVAKRRSK